MYAYIHLLILMSFCSQDHIQPQMLGPCGLPVWLVVIQVDNGIVSLMSPSILSSRILLTGRAASTFAVCQARLLAAVFDLFCYVVS